MKSRLVKLGNHYYVIDDYSEIEIGDYFYHPNKALSTQIEKCDDIVVQDNIRLINSFVGYVCKRVTHSTEYGIGNLISLSDVDELLKDGKMSLI